MVSSLGNAMLRFSNEFSYSTIKRSPLCMCSRPRIAGSRTVSFECHTRDFFSVGPGELRIYQGSAAGCHEVRRADLPRIR